MDQNNNNETRDFAFYLRCFFGIFGHWILAILQTIFPFLLRRKSVKDEIVLITGAGKLRFEILSELEAFLTSLCVHRCAISNPYIY